MKGTQPHALHPCPEQLVRLAFWNNGNWGNSAVEFLSTIAGALTASKELPVFHWTFLERVLPAPIFTFQSVILVD